MTDTPTPETSAAQFGTGRVSVDFARRLELSRDQWRDVATKLAAALQEVHYGELNRYPRPGMYPALDKFNQLNTKPCSTPI